MPFNPDLHHRRSIRLRDYDYRQSGIYFVTLCVELKTCLFGDIVDDNVQLNAIGEIVEESWLWLEKQYPYVNLDSFVIMPNHMHGLIIIKEGGSRAAPTDAQTTNEISVKRKPLGQLIGAFKTISAKQINLLYHARGERLWQRDFYDRIVRNERGLNAFRRYIHTNPGRWAIDHENPLRVRK